MIPRHGLTALLSVVLALFAVVLLTGCEDETGPLIRTGTLAGVVRDAAGAYVGGIAVGVIYDVPTPPVAKAVGPVVDPVVDPIIVPAGLRPLDTIWPVEGLYIEQNYPNPFAEQTTLRFGLPDSGAVNLSLLDVMGEPVATLVDSTLAAGLYEYGWLAQSGPALPNGYALALLRLTVGETVRTAYLYGMLHNADDPQARGPNDRTDNAGEFALSLATVASGIRIPLATIDGPDVIGHFTVPDHVRVEIENEGLTEDISIQLHDMSAWYYLEFLLP